MHIMHNPQANANNKAVTIAVQTACTNFDNAYERLEANNNRAEAMIAMWQSLEALTVIGASGTPVWKQYQPRLATYKAIASKWQRKVAS